MEPSFQDRRAQAARHPVPAILDSAVLAELEDIMDPAQLRTLAAQFRTFLEAVARAISPSADPVTVEREAHGLKSAAGWFGCRELTETGACLERAARERRGEPLEPAIAELLAAGWRALEALDRHFERPTAG